MKRRKMKRRKMSKRRMRTRMMARTSDDWPGRHGKYIG
jgi:hypothetical protein